LVLDDVVDDQRTRQWVQWLVTETVGPPAFGVGNVDRPLDPILAVRSRMAELVIDTGHARAEHDRSSVGMVKHTAKGKPSTHLSGFDASHAEVSYCCHAGVMK
jgi:hypothetical protein